MVDIVFFVYFCKSYNYLDGWVVGVSNDFIFGCEVVSIYFWNYEFFVGVYLLGRRVVDNYCFGFCKFWCLGLRSIFFGGEKGYIGFCSNSSFYIDYGMFFILEGYFFVYGMFGSNRNEFRYWKIVFF